MALPGLPEPWASEPTATIEQRILGCCLFPLEGDDQHALIRQVMEILGEERWSHPWHRELARLLWTQSAPGKTIEAVPVFAPLLGTVPAPYVHDLWEAADTAQLLPQRLQELRRRWEEHTTPQP